MQDETSTIPFIYDAKTLALYKIFLLNILLGIITLGIYHYWGKTRYRRYVSSSFSLIGDRFEYTGYGIELFWGFIKALVLLLIVSIPFFYAFDQIDTIGKEIEKNQPAFHSSPMHTNTSSESLSLKELIPSKTEISQDIVATPEQIQKLTLFGWIIIGYFIFYYAYLPFVAVFGSLRYRASRTRWRGIRGHMKGSSLLYGVVGLSHLILKCITLGFWIPIGDQLTHKYKMHRLYFGNQGGHFEPNYGKLFLSHISTLAIAFVITIGLILLATVFTPNTTPSTDLAQAALLFNLKIAHFLLPIIVIGALLALWIVRYWYKATLLRVKYERLKFGDIGFTCTITGSALLKQLWGNYFIYIFTLGLGAPLVTQRRMKFFCQHVHLLGNISQSNVLQATGKKDTSGEGLSSVFDINIGLF